MMSRDQKRGKVEKPGGSEVAEMVVAAVKASKEISKTALVWALTHVVQPGDCITLFVVVPSPSSGRKKFHHPGATSEQRGDITNSCSQMILQLHDVYDPNKINVKIKIVSGSPCRPVVLRLRKLKPIVTNSEPISRHGIIRLLSSEA